MIKYLSLGLTPKENILEVFNEAFSDYLVPLQLTAKQFENKIFTESIDFNFSIGVFENSKLIGFILHGVDIIEGKKILYNAGTGVILAKRGNRYISKGYNTFMPVLKSNNTDAIVLEVIEGNDAAINVYEHIGFTKIMEYNCYKCQLTSFRKSIKSGFEIKITNDYYFERVISFWNFDATWQNSVKAVQQLRYKNFCLCAIQNELLVGYIIYNPKTKRIQQFGVDKNYRCQGVG